MICFTLPVRLPSWMPEGTVPLAASPWETMVTLILARLEAFVEIVGLGVCLLFRWSRCSFCSKLSTCSPDTGTVAHKGSKVKHRS